MAGRDSWTQTRLAAGLAAISMIVAGCGGGASPAQPSSAAGSPRVETATEAAWRTKTEQFTHDLDSGLQALASTASIDAYQAVANLGPLTYCSQNLGAVGSPPPVYQLVYGSLATACSYLETGSREWRDEASGHECGSGIDGAVFQIRQGRAALSRAEARLAQFAQSEPLLRGGVAVRVEEWASPIALEWWTLEMQPALTDVDKKVSNGSTDPIADLWAEHFGGEAGTVSDCREILDRYAKTPPNATAQRLLDSLHSGCDALSVATDDSDGSHFDEAAYQQAKARLRRAVTQLQVVAP